MNMKFCHYHYEKAKHPKFYDKACELLEKAKNCAFTSQNEVDIFVNLVKEALTDHLPDGHSARVLHSHNRTGGQIRIVSGKLDDDIARPTMPKSGISSSTTSKLAISSTSARK